MSIDNYKYPVNMSYSPDYEDITRKLEQLGELKHAHNLSTGEDGCKFQASQGYITRSCQKVVPIP